MSCHVANFVGCLMFGISNFGGLFVFQTKNISRDWSGTHGNLCDHLDGCLILILCSKSVFSATVVIVNIF